MQALEANSGEVTEDHLLLLCKYSNTKCGPLFIKIYKELRPLQTDPLIPILTFTEKFDNLFQCCEANNTAETTAKLLYAILTAEVKSTFHKINVHAALKPAEIRKLFEPALCQARLLSQETYCLKNSRTPFVTVSCN